MKGIINLKITLNYNQMFEDERQFKFLNKKLKQGSTKEELLNMHLIDTTNQVIEELNLNDYKEKDGITYEIDWELKEGETIE